MPIYEYACHGCGSSFERLVRRFDEAVACPDCASAAVEKQLSVFAVASAKSSSPSTAFAGCGGGACASPEGPCAGGACALGD
jgi:putative FmdB family regulatory protein